MKMMKMIFLELALKFYQERKK